MKLLLDEQVPRRLAVAFPETFDVATVQQAGWSGIGNGRLLRLAAEAGYFALVSADKNMAYQQNPSELPLVVIVMDAPRIRLPDLLPLVPQVVALCDPATETGFYRVTAKP